MEVLESWRQVWRDGFAPLLSKQQLEALRDALASDDPRLTQGSTSTPPPLMCVADWPVEAACVLGYCGVVTEGGFCEPDKRGVPDEVAKHARVGKVEEAFAKLCFDCDQRIGELAACRWFLNWYDDTPRDQMRRELLAEVDRNLKERESSDATVSPAGFGSTA